jgi:hypothetical protein
VPTIPFRPWRSKVTASPVRCCTFPDSQSDQKIIRNGQTTSGRETRTG